MRQNIKVIIAEDSNLIRTGIMKFLKRFSEFEVLGDCDDGEEAVALSLKVKPDLAVMDIKMPRMDGIDATRVIKRLLPEVRVLMLTSFSDDDEVFGAFGAGADGYCLKGITMERLAIAMRAVADGASWLDPGIAERVLKHINAKRPDRGMTNFSPALDDTSELPPLEKEVLRLLVDGMDVRSISERLFLPRHEIDACLRQIFQKLAVPPANFPT